MAILAAIIAIAGGILTAVTMGLFSAIEIDTESFYSNFVVIPAAVCVWGVATFIVKKFSGGYQQNCPDYCSYFYTAGIDYAGCLPGKHYRYRGKPVYRQRFPDPL
jgi:hypothetical protein